MAEENADYDHIITEITAGMCLTPRGPEDLSFNEGCQRAVRIVQRYRDGKGLFQMTQTEESHGG